MTPTSIKSPPLLQTPPPTSNKPPPSTRSSPPPLQPPLPCFFFRGGALTEWPPPSNKSPPLLPTSPPPLQQVGDPYPIGRSHKACAKYVPVLLCDTKLAQRKLLHTASSFAEKLLHTASFLTEKLLHTTSFYTEKLLHTASFHTQQAFTHRTLTHSAFTHGKRLRTHTETFTRRRFYTPRSFYTQQALHSKSFTQSKLLQKKVFTQRSFLVHNHNRNCSSKTGPRRQSEIKAILKHFLKGLLKGKLLAPKLRKSADKSLSQPWCSHSKTIYEIQLHKTIVLRMQPRHQACSRGTKQPWRSHYHAICRHCVAKHNRTTRNGVRNCSSKTGSRRQSEKKTFQKHFLKGFLKGKLLAPKLRKSADKSLSQPWCSHSNTIYEIQLQKTLVLRMQPRHQATLTHTRGTFHRRLQPLYTEKYEVSCSSFLPNTCPTQHSCSHYNAFRRITWLTCNSLRTWQRQMTTIMQPFQCDLQTLIKDTHRTTHTGTATRCRTEEEEPVASGTTPAAPAAHTRYLSSPAATTLHRKIQGFVLRLPPQHKPHAAFMQPFFCDVLLCDVKSHTALHQCQFFCDVLYCYVMSSLTRPIIIGNSFVMYCYVMSSLTPPFINVNSFVMYC